MINLPIAFDGEAYVGYNLSDVVYLWTHNDIACYIGITENSIHSRISAHLLGQKPSLFQRKLRKYKNEFKCYILEQNKDYNKLKELEKMYIQHYNTYAYNNPESGYNLTLGGDGGVGYKHSDVSKEKMRLAKIGKSQSQETIDKRVISRIGYKHSDETKKLLSDMKKGKKFSVEHRMALSKNHWKKNKPIIT
jgi:group I intron endonuclease